ncbi:MAG: hypothetical protein P8Y96_13750 [Desulfuromonadales bacterium]
MKNLIRIGTLCVALLVAIIFVSSSEAAPKVKSKPETKSAFDWATVVNNNDVMPTKGCEQDPDKCRPFNSYNPPSVNEDGLVVFRARSRGGHGETNGHNGAGEDAVTSNTVEAGDGDHNGGSGNGGSGTEHGNQPVHGIYTRDMSVNGSPVIRILDRKTGAPQPNNLGTTFVETPSFPRIDQGSATIATRGNHPPVWRYGAEGDETRVGTTGIYTNPFGPLITGASKLGLLEDFAVYEVPPELPNTPFEVFPGAPAVTGGDTIVFKGNYTVDGTGLTGVYFRQLTDDPLGGPWPTALIANNIDTKIPGTDTIFGSVSPPSAANGRVIFAGFDNEEAPTLGGLYLAPLEHEPDLTTLVSIGERVPGEAPSATFNGLGEGGAFDGRLVGFWGSWGEETRTVRLYCPTEGNRDRIAYCNQQLVCTDTGVTEADPNSICEDNRCYQEKQVPAHQGIFVHDTRTGRTWVIAKADEDFDDFLFWNYSGRTPCTGKGHGEEGVEEDGEFVRWRSSAFLAVAGPGRAGAAYRVVFKARTGDFDNGVYTDPVDGIYLRRGPGRLPIETVLDTTMAGQSLDPQAPADSVINELGLEREGLRGRWLTVNAKIGVEGSSEEDGIAGIYLTEIR